MERKHLAFGGDASMDSLQGLDRLDTNFDQYHPGGLINSSVAGRTDRLPLAVATDSHVIPADAVSAAGQGSTMAGARMWQEILGMGPYGIKAATIPRGRGQGIPAAPHPIGSQASAFENPSYARGGSASHGTSKILAAGGEMIVPRETVYDNGLRALRKEGAKNPTEAQALKRGHEVIDKTIGIFRKYALEFLKHAPPPKK